MARATDTPDTPRADLAALVAELERVTLAARPLGALDVVYARPAPQGATCTCWHPAPQAAQPAATCGWCADAPPAAALAAWATLPPAARVARARALSAAAGTLGGA